MSALSFTLLFLGVSLVSVCLGFFLSAITRFSSDDNDKEIIAHQLDIINTITHENLKLKEENKKLNTLLDKVRDMVDGLEVKK